MPFRPEHSLLNLNLEKMHTIDTRSVENLFGLWAVFSKASCALEDGKRLENLSWRLWNRETFCCCPEQTKTRSRSSLPPRCDITKTSSIPRIPDLASSVDTVSTAASDDNEQDDDDLQSPPPHVVRPELTRLDSCDSRSRGRERHISPGAFEKIVGCIKQKKVLEPLDTLSIPAPVPECAPTPSEPEQPQTRQEPPTIVAGEADPQSNNAIQSSNQQSSGSSISTAKLNKQAIESSNTTVATSNVSDELSSRSSSDGNSSVTAMSTHSIVRGFTPGGLPSSYRSQTNLAAQPTPILKHSPRNVPEAKKKGAMFTLGASSEEDESSFGSNVYKNSISSVAGGLHRSAAPPVKKQASFREHNLVSQVQDNPVFESDDEDDDDDDVISEDAIEDDEEDSSEWEDEGGDDDRSDTDDKPYFQRVDSRPNLTSHRSLLTSMMHEGDRAKALQSAASRSAPAMRRSRTSSPNGPSVAASPSQEARNQSNLRPPQGMPMPTSSSSAQLSLSPRTTRRNMLSTELTESLRKNLLWERQNKSAQNLAAIKRRHTANDVKNLKQYPEPVNMSVTGNKGQFSNDFFHAGLGEFHTKGW